MKVLQKNYINLSEVEKIKKINHVNIRNKRITGAQ